MAIQNRRGYEADFDPAKMLPGEWAVSLDTKYVRMCFAPGECLRMATYEAFEQDMEQIQNILSEAKNIEEAIDRINTEVSENANLVVEYTEQAKQYRDEAKQYRDEAQMIAGGDFIGPESTVNFIQADIRENISALDSVKIIFGKIAKWFEDLKMVAFSGSYDDLSNKPTILDTYEEIMANTTTNKVAGSVGVKEGFEKLEDYEYNSYTLESNDNIDSGTIHVEKKNGWCHVFGNVKPKALLENSVMIFSDLPKPRWGFNFGVPVSATTTTYNRPLYVSVSTDGGLYIRFGSANSHYFDLSYCYIEE